MFPSDLADFMQTFEASQQREMQFKKTPWTIWPQFVVLSKENIFFNTTKMQWRWAFI